MLKKNLFYSPLWQERGLAVIRIIVGLFLIFHGSEIFDNEKMKTYFTSDAFKGYSSPPFIVYLGKGTEFVTGLMLALGFYTRITTIVIMLTFLYITFFVGNGKFWYEDQHPFLFVLLALVFFFTGSGKYSADHLIIQSKERVKELL